MITLPIFPLLFVDILGSALVLLLSWAAFINSRKLLARDPENALWLFLYWLTLAFLAFGLSRALGHIIGHILVFAGHGALWGQMRPYSGGAALQRRFECHPVHRHRLGHPLFP